jgi:signal peptidase I
VTLEAVDGLQARWPDRPAGPPPPRPPRLGILRETPVLVALALGLALAVKTFLVQAFYIPSGSMVPTLEVGDRVLVNKLAYRFREPRRGEVVVFVARRAEHRNGLAHVVAFLTEGLGLARPPEEDRIKRVIGLPGETVEVRDGAVRVTTVDGRRLVLEEPYVAGGDTPGQYGPAVVPAGSLFVLGDNRANSEDSRVTGPIRRDQVIGKAFVVVWPPGRIRVLGPAEREVPVAAGLGGPALAWARWRRRRLCCDGGRRRERRRP